MNRRNRIGKWRTSTWITVLGAIFCGTPYAGEVVTPPSVEGGYGVVASTTGLRCYFAGRWIASNLGTAVIEVRGAEVSGVMRQFDTSLARNLYEMRFTATVDERTGSATGTQQYTFLTGFPRSTYSGEFGLELFGNANAMTMVYSNGLGGNFRERLIKTQSGECS